MLQSSSRMMCRSDPQIHEDLVEVLAAKGSFVIELEQELCSYYQQKVKHVEPLRGELLLLHVKSSQFRWFQHLMLPGRLPLGANWACPTGRRLRGRPTTRREGLDISSGLGTSGDPPGGAGKRDVWTSLLRLQPP